MTKKALALPEPIVYEKLMINSRFRNRLANF